MWLQNLPRNKEKYVHLKLKRVKTRVISIFLVYDAHKRNQNFLVITATIKSYLIAKKRVHTKWVREEYIPQNSGSCQHKQKNRHEIWVNSICSNHNSSSSTEVQTFAQNIKWRQKCLEGGVFLRYFFEVSFWLWINLCIDRNCKIRLSW